MRTYDKSLMEVWEWKEKVYDEIKGLSTKDYIKKIKNDADAVLSKNRVKLISTPFSDKRKKVA
jgi:hypothetical protein